jgi:hypothetical protein
MSFYILKATIYNRSHTSGRKALPSALFFCKEVNLMKAAIIVIAGIMAMAGPVFADESDKINY